MPAQSEATAVFPSEILSKSYKMPKWDITENVVISGMAGKFPSAESVTELYDNLMNKVDMVTGGSERWEEGLHGLPPRMGKIKDLSKFDSTFFGVHPKQAHLMDPQLRILLECTYEAIVDSGYDPKELSGSRTGVFIGVCSAESNDLFSSDLSEVNGYALTGGSFSMFANRLSFTYNFKGPSFAMDTACSSSLFAMNQAVLAMRTNQCDAAIIAGCNICLRPATSLHFYKLNMLSPDGACKAFDASANGYCRSETIGVAFLQLESKARRIYATISHIKTNTDGSKEEGITFPSEVMQTQLIDSVYKEAQIDPRNICYVEAHGTGTKAGDPVEISAVSKVFCEGRTKPLLIGSVKSSIGHAEPASGVGALAKIILSLESRIVPPNIHFNTPNPDITSLIEGKVKVVTEPTKLETDYVALNSFGFGGVNVHALLKGNPRNPTYEEGSLPELVLCCDRAEEGVGSLLKYLENTTVPSDTYGFVRKLSKRSSMTYRGYTLLRKGAQKVTSEIQKLSMEKRPVWFVFSGMGTQWPGMGRDLLQLKTFAKSIHHSAELLKPYGINLMQILTSLENKTSDNKREIIPSFVAIAAIQVALVDMLSELGIVPDGICGHSVGELGCAYADGCFTAEQMILSAYWRGKCVEQANLIAGSMAAVGLTWEETKTKCPKGVLPACHNSEDTVTVSGPVDKIASFIKQLQDENIFVREVDSCGYAFHSSYVNPAAAGLQKALEKIIPNPKPRTSRWISSSIPESKWNMPIAKNCSAAYLVNNLVSPVLFREALMHIPSNAVVIEIAPHCLLQAVLKRSLSSSCTFVGLMNKKEKNNLEFFFSSVGKLYNCGLNPAIESFYPKVNYPVPRGIPMISPFIKWDHSQTWTTVLWRNHPLYQTSSEYVASIDVSSPESPDYFMLGHCIDGRVLFPATGYLVLAWKALAKRRGEIHEHMSIEVEDYVIHRATILSKTGVTRFMVNVMDVTGEFEISESGTVAATGIIRQLDEQMDADEDRIPIDNSSTITLNSKDIYKELRLRGYDYGPSFQGIIEVNGNGEFAKIKWSGNWEVFLDNMLQVSVFGEQRALFLPTRIQSIKIDPKYHKSICSEEGVPLYCDKYLNEMVCGGVQLKGLKASLAPRRQDQQTLPLLEEYHFVPYNEINVIETHEQQQIQEYTEVCSALAKKILEASGKNKTQISDVMNGFIEASDNVLKNYLSSSNESFVLLNSLKEISQLPSNDSNFQENLNNIVKQLQINLPNDILSSTLLRERTLRTALDITVENVLLRKLKILEISTSSHNLSKPVQSFLLNYNLLLNTDYTVTCPAPEDSNDSAKIVQWDLISTPPSEFANLDLVIAKDICSKYDFQQLLENMSTFVKNDGFLLLIQRTDLTPAEKFLSAVGGLTLPTKSQEELETLFKTVGLTIISKKYDGLASTMYLVRRSDTVRDPTKQTVIRAIDQKYSWVEELKSALYKTSSSSVGENVWLVADDCNTNGIIGLVNCLRQEIGGERIRCIFNASKNQKLPLLNFNESIYKDLLQKDLVMNVYRDGQWGSFRHISFQQKHTVSTEYALVHILTRGDLSSLRWIESPVKYSSKDLLCYCYYTALNFKDIMLATGKINVDAFPGYSVTQECILGMEFAGRDIKGNRIMGILDSYGLSTTALRDPAFTWDVPDHWTLEEASTVPVVYSTAYYALIVRGRLQKGESVLIHSGSGGVGQAAISIALSMGCKVYTTVGSLEKRNFLKRRFPQLTDQSFSNSRDLSFETHIMKATKGRGVDVVLNSLAEEKLQASVRCVARHGRFLEIGKYDLAKNTPLGMNIFLRNIAFHGILLDAIMHRSVVRDDKRETFELVLEGIKTGVVQPLPAVVFDSDKLEDAFRFMATGRHIGKVVLKLREEEPQSCVIPKPLKMNALPYTVCDPKKTYIICGGLGGFGLELVSWLTIRGAKHFVLTSRSGPKTGYQHFRLKSWKEEGLDVIVSNLDASQYSNAVELLELAKKSGPIGGIFNLAMVLKDAMFENQTEEDFIKVTEPKVSGTYNLDKASRQLCPNLEYFVVFSSVSCGRGNPGQSNYGYANSVMERICEERCRDGFPGLAIEWGAIGDVGVILETMGGGNDMVIGGTLPQRINSCMKVLDTFLQQRHPVVSSIVPAERKMKKQDSNKQDLLKSILHIIGIQDPSTMDHAITLGELGMDSLMGVEVKQTLERDYDVILSMQEIRQLSLKKLKEMGGQPQSTPAKAATKTERSVTNLKRLHLVPKDCIVKMNDSKEGTPLIVIHSIEGVVTNLSYVAKNLTCPVIGFQCTVDVPQSSCKDMASHYYELIKSELKLEGPYNLLGYSFGSVIAFEIAVKMQENGATVSKLFFLDGSPALVTSYTKKHESRLNNDAMKDAEAMYSFLQQYIEISDKLQLIKDLINLPSYQARSQHAIDIMVASTEYQDRDDISAAADSYYRKLICANEYECTQKFKGNVVLIKASESLFGNSQLGDDFGTSEFCDGEITVHSVKGNHTSFLQDKSGLEVADVIMKETN